MSKEFKVGTITVIAIGMLYYGFNFLKGNNIFSSSHKYYVKYTNVAGLSISNPVLYNGLKVGRVSNLKLSQDKGIIIVTLDIEDAVHLKKDAIASLANDGLFGGKSIVLELGEKKEKLKYGDTLRPAVTSGMLDQFEPVADNVNTTIKKMNEVLSKLAETDLEGLVNTLKSSVTSTTGELKGKVQKLNVQNINSLVLTSTDKINQLDGVIQGAEKILHTLSQVDLTTSVEKLEKTISNLESFTHSLKNNEGTLGKLITHDSTYQQINQLLTNLNKLTVHLNEYPKDFFAPLGRKHPKQKGLKATQKK